MKRSPGNRPIATQIELSLQAAILDCLDDYCDVYGIDRDKAINHLLQGALHNALPNPEWSTENTPLMPAFPINPEQEASRSDQAGEETTTPLTQRYQALAENKLIQKRHNAKD